MFKKYVVVSLMLVSFTVQADIEHTEQELSYDKDYPKRSNIAEVGNFIPALLWTAVALGSFYRLVKPLEDQDALLWLVAFMMSSKWATEESRDAYKRALIKEYLHPAFGKVSKGYLI